MSNRFVDCIIHNKLNWKKNKSVISIYETILSVTNNKREKMKFGNLEIKRYSERSINLIMDGLTANDLKENKTKHRLTANTDRTKWQKETD